MSSRNAIFFRILQSDPDEKHHALRQSIFACNQGFPATEVFSLPPSGFDAIPGSPFSYWVSDYIRNIFEKMHSLERGNIDVRIGMSTGKDFRFLRLYWEAPVDGILDGSEIVYWEEEHNKFHHWCNKETFHRPWVLFAKGGEFSPYYSDIHLLVNWKNAGSEIKNHKHPITGKLASRPQNLSYFFNAGLTWPLRTTSKLSVRILPYGCAFGHKGPGIFVIKYDENLLYVLLALLNSNPFYYLLELQLGAATSAARSYEVGIIQNMPIPPDKNLIYDRLSTCSKKAFEISKSSDYHSEISHLFRLPALLSLNRDDEILLANVKKIVAFEVEHRNQLQMIQDEINQLVAELYNVHELYESIDNKEILDEELIFIKEDESDDDPQELAGDPAESLVADLIMWCVGVAYGRWDVRLALNQSLLPELQEPFDPLPVCAPGALVGSDRLPAKSNGIVSEAWLRARPNVISLPEKFQGQVTIPESEYPLNIPWQGILVDDPTHPGDIVTSVRQVLQLIWGDQVNAIESEACQILGFDTLRDWFRDPKKGFYNFHIKRYSKSRRKAPIYWLLQSSRRNYGIWFYYHRLTKDTYFLAGRDYIDTKIKLEENQLSEMRQAAASKSGSALKTHEKEIATQVDLVEEIKAFGKALDEVAFLELEPDLNDGVVLNIAPLREVTPWNEARKYWNELIQGKFTWSNISQQLLKKGHRKG